MSRGSSLHSPDLADQAFSRTAGAELIPGNRVRLLRDGAENFPAWIRAIRNARKWINLETYILYDDAVGREFADLLCEKAAEGVHVRILYDWFGTWGYSSRWFWRRIAARGVEVRCFNPPAFDSPFACFSRDHRKMISVDGRIGFVTGLCIGQRWSGYPDRKMEPWRDTGIEIEGPAVQEIDRAFADTWAVAGPPLDLETIAPVRDPGNVALRVVASVPTAGGVYRLDQLITTLARNSIWLSDAYFAGTAAYVHALRSAARSGVDVRLLIPGANNLPVFRAISRAGLRPLLEAGVRVFEWNGPMMHAKTAVVDGCWSRVGSTNLNIASWMGNWELDVVIEDEKFAREMESMYLDDLTRSTEIVLEGRWRRRPISTRHGPAKSLASGVADSAVGTAAGMMRLSRSVGAAMAGSRELGSAEAVIMFWASALLALIAGVLILWPRIFAVPLAVLSAWLALSLLLQAIKLWRRR